VLFLFDITNIKQGLSEGRVGRAHYLGWGPGPDVEVLL